MSIYTTIKGLFSFRASPESPSTSLAKPSEWLTRLFSPRAKSGAVVSEKTVVGMSAVWRAINLISESIASMPPEVIRKRRGGVAEVRDDHPIYALINVEPHPLYTPFDWFYTMTALCILTGNSFSVIRRDPATARPTQLRIIDSLTNEVDAFLDEDDRLVYHVKGQKETKTYRSEDIIHFKWTTLNGLAGLNPVKAQADSFGFGLAARDLGNVFFKNGAHLGGIIKHPSNLTSEAKKRLSTSWNAAFAGSDNAGKTAILDEGMDYQQFEFDPQKAQMIEAQKFNIEDIARIFGVPPHLLASLDRATFNNIEHLSLEFAKYTVRPWATRIEQELNRKLFRSNERGRYGVRFDMSAFLRGDMESMAEYLNKMVSSGIMSVNDARKWLDMNPVDGGDVHAFPLNMTTLDRAGQAINEPENEVADGVE